MKICRFGNNRLGVVDGTCVRDVTPALDVLPNQRYPFPPGDLLIAHLPRVRERIAALLDSAPKVALAEIALLSPVANPGKIIAAPVNYKKHLEEALADKGIHHGNLVHEIHKAGLFLKATSALVGAGAGVALVHTDRRNDHEVELAVVIGATGRDIKAGDAMGHVAGYCIGLDITIRGTEDRSFRKSPDSYAVLGPWLVTSDELTDPGNLDLSLEVDGEVRQQANTSDLVLPVPQLIEMASSFYTLHPGDVIITGTPQGVGPLQAGNRMLAAIAGIGSMAVAVRNHV